MVRMATIGLVLIAALATVSIGDDWVRGAFGFPRPVLTMMRNAQRASYGCSSSQRYVQSYGCSGPVETVQIVEQPVVQAAAANVQYVNSYECNNGVCRLVRRAVPVRAKPVEKPAAKVEVKVEKPKDDNLLMPWNFGASATIPCNCGPDCECAGDCKCSQVARVYRDPDDVPEYYVETPPYRDPDNVPEYYVENNKQPDETLIASF